MIPIFFCKWRLPIFATYSSLLFHLFAEIVNDLAQHASPEKVATTMIPIFFYGFHFRESFFSLRENICTKQGEKYLLVLSRVCRTMCPSSSRLNASEEGFKQGRSKASTLKETLKRHRPKSQDHFCTKSKNDKKKILQDHE